MFSRWWSNAHHTFQEPDSETDISSNRCIQRRTSFRLSTSKVAKHSPIISDHFPSLRGNHSHSNTSSKPVPSKAVPAVGLPTLNQSRWSGVVSDDSSTTSPEIENTNRGDCYKVVNLRIPLPSCKGSWRREGGSKHTSREGGRRQRGESPPQDKVRRLSTPTLTQLDLFAYGEHYLPKAKNQQCRDVAGTCLSPMHTSSFLASLAAKQTDSPPSSSLPRKPHPSTEYPDLSLSSTRLPTTLTHQRCIGDYILRYSHKVKESCSSVGLCLENVRLLHSPLLVEKHTYTVKRSSELPVLNIMSSNHNTRQPAMHSHRQHSAAIKSPQKRRCAMDISMTGCVRASSCKQRKTACYPDPLSDGPPGYQRRLAQMAVLDSETARWERMKRTNKRYRGSSSQGSL